MLGLHDVRQARLAEQLDQRARVRARQGGLVAHVGIELARRAPEHRDRAALARVVPDRRRDDAAGPRHPRHLAQARDRVGHEVHDELRERGVERVVAERQRLARACAASTSGSRSRNAATNAVDGSTAATADAPRRATSSAVSAPGPLPTSSTRCPAAMPAKSASWGRAGASGAP